MRTLLLFFGFLVATLSPGRSETVLHVASTHPLLTDTLRQIGADRVEILDLMEAGGDVHHFELSAADLARLKDVDLVFASGMGLESFLDKLRDALPGIPVIEVGKAVPPLAAAEANHGHDHGEHDHGDPAAEHDEQEHDRDHEHDHAHASGIDPHWWHTPGNMKRATRVIAAELKKRDSANAGMYDANARAVSKSLDALDHWAKRELAEIPEEQRKLVTAHAAFTYFCAEYGFEPVPILGISREQEASPREVVDVIRQIREQKLRAVFPEDQANPKVLQEITRETGVVLGEPLMADGTSKGAGSTFEGMFRHNVKAIVKAFMTPKP